MKKLTKTSLAILISLSVSIMGFSAVSFAKSEIKVGIQGPMTGPGSLMGQGQRDGSLFVIDKVNAAGGIDGRKIKPIIMDDQAQITLGVNAIKKLVYKDKVVAVIGTPNSPVCLATMEVTREAETPQIVFGVAPKITQMGNPWVIRITPSDRILAGHFVTFASQELKLKKLAVLHDS